MSNTIVINCTEDKTIPCGTTDEFSVSHLAPSPQFTFNVLFHSFFLTKFYNLLYQMPLQSQETHYPFSVLTLVSRARNCSEQTTEFVYFYLVHSDWLVLFVVCWQVLTIFF